MPIIWPGMDEWILGALSEDVGSGDVTSEATVPVDAMALMEWVAKSRVVACGLFVAERAFTMLDAGASVNSCLDEGAEARPGEVIFSVRGNARALLTGERLALNVAQRLSGIAASTRDYVAAVEGSATRIAATRKTQPYLRRLEKYAVSVGGGVPHRYGLDDGILIKDNHIALAGSIAAATSRARARCHHLLKIEVEVTNFDEIEEAVAAGADLLLLDNMGVDQLTRAVELVGGRALCEASGNMSLDRVAAVAATGVDVISVGALTHSVMAADVSARMRAVGGTKLNS